MAKVVAARAVASVSRPRENRPVARLVAVEAAPAISASPSAAPLPPAERRVAPTYRFVCHLCGEDEVLLYRPPETDQHVCGACEEDDLVSGVERRRLLHNWWPLAFLVLLVLGGAFFVRCMH